MSEKEKMLRGEGYIASDKELVKDRKNARKLTRMYNQTTEDEDKKRSEILKNLLGTIGNNIFIEPNFRCDYGYNIHLGENFFSNFDCIMLDICKINIGDNVMFGPGVHIYTAYHPIDSTSRISGIEYGSPVNIGDNVWIGGKTIINPGVNIGENTVIGSGSVVVKDIPANCVAVGNPCKVIKKI
ncbi:sugar O-acetyltransferase [Paraclostridium bifermentans]|uniref:sugar O-acetyltransferase n=1 Tax=Paraclostridium bifermentans TaxID=1490 RepID=UPI00359CA974